MQVHCSTNAAIRPQAVVKAQLIPQKAFSSRLRVAQSQKINRCSRLAISKLSKRVVLVRAAEIPAGQDPEKYAAANKEYAVLTEKIEVCLVSTTPRHQ